ncbi:MAG: hypothetical protein NUW22_12400 [Acidobacteria bacterium]|nr:hypothetical protein [Acidobacteriota bacterium]
MANPALAFGALQKSAAGTRLDRKTKKAAETVTQRRKVYKSVEVRDKMRCRACGVRVRKTAGLAGNRLEHHHVNGRTGPAAETTRNVCLLCKSCHDERHVKRTLNISGNADGVLAISWSSGAKAGRWISEVPR